MPKDFMMPFGSICNLYGNVNQGKNIPTEQLLEDIRKLKDLAVEITEDKKGVPAQNIEL
jgi:hypothetical protein